MSTLSSTSLPPSNSAALENAAIAQDEVVLQTPISWRGDWLVTEGSLRYLVKRTVDMTGALAGLFLLWPVMVVIALAIKFTSPGPILFQQARRGYRGRLFNVLKFRTMTVDAEQRLVDLERSNESAGGVLFKLRNDPRVTPVGAFLRRYSLDELPQLINVLFGEMSLVGPRPLQLRDSDKLLLTDPEAYHLRLRVLPGVTGPWQIGGRSDVDYSRMLELDLGYVRNWSLARDLWIICKTFVVVIRPRGAY
jgi:lipopolysaccharide/colanic/teichoic acid biosynthesis glycosyltransferase